METQAAEIAEIQKRIEGREAGLRVAARYMHNLHCNRVLELTCVCVFCVLLLPLGSDTDRARREHEALVRSLDATRAELARTKDELVAKAAKLDAREAATAEREQASMRMKEEVSDRSGCVDGFVTSLTPLAGSIRWSKPWQ